MREIRRKTDLRIALAGNPNVGKSSIFNQLTGLSVVTANYPGKTIDLNFGVTRFDSLTVGIIDLPGTYGLSAISDDQWVARRAVLEGHPDAVVVVVDASNLQRNLYLVLQLIELGLRIVVALNLIDHAAKIGLKIDHVKLSELLGVPVVPTVAIRGEGVRRLIQAAIDLAADEMKIRPPKIRYDRDIETAIGALEEDIQKNLQERPRDLSPRALAVQLLEEDQEFISALKSTPKGEELLQNAANLAKWIEERYGEPAALRVTRERYGLTGTITDAVQSRIEQPEILSQRLKHYTLSPYTGIPLMVAVMLGIFAFIFGVGGLLSELVSSSWASYASPAIDGAIYFLVGRGWLAQTLIWGADAGVLAVLAIGLPYVLTFYILLSLLEDTGYLNSMVFFADKIMHKLGLHGRALIPIITGAGCNVPAIMGTRVLTTRREKLLASTLIVLVPCSARTAVILGAVSYFVGWIYALLIYAIEAVVIYAVGFGLHRLLPGESAGLVMETFPLRIPSAIAVLKKTWSRFAGFITMAFPIVALGSLVLGGLYEGGYMWSIIDPLTPFTEGVLGLPPIAGLTLVLGILRKELTLELLVALAASQYGGGVVSLLSFMTGRQLFIFALVVTIYIPCIATVAALGRELGWKSAILIMLFTVGLAILIGGIVYRLTPFIGLAG